MSDQMNLWSSHNATSSRELGDGASHCGSQDGPMIVRYGRDLAHASLSARQALEAGCLMSGTSGRTGTTSSTSAALQRSLESRLRAKTDSIGSTLYRLTWKHRDTPLQRQICALRASAHRTSGKGSGSSGWPTPTMPSGGQRAPDGTTATGRTPDGKKVQVTLKDVAAMSGWPTPTTRDWKDGSNPDVNVPLNSLLGRTVWLSGWPAPHLNSTTGAGSDGRAGGLNIQTAAQLAGWPTPTVTDAARGVAYDPMAKNMTLNMAAARTISDGPARLTVNGEMLTGCSAGMESGGQLNPAHVRWMMGYPPEWDACAVTAMPSSRKPRKQSLKV